MIRIKFYYKVETLIPNNYYPVTYKQFDNELMNSSIINIQFVKYYFSLFLCS